MRGKGLGRGVGREEVNPLSSPEGVEGKGAFEAPSAETPSPPPGPEGLNGDGVDQLTSNMDLVIFAFPRSRPVDLGVREGVDQLTPSLTGGFRLETPGFDQLTLLPRAP